MVILRFDQRCSVMRYISKKYVGTPPHTILEKFQQLAQLRQVWNKMLGKQVVE